MYTRSRDLIVPLTVITPLLVGIAGARVLLWPDSLPLRMALEVSYRVLLLTASIALLRARRGRWEPSAWLLALSLPILHLAWSPFTDRVPAGGLSRGRNHARLEHAAGRVRRRAHAGETPLRRSADSHRQHRERAPVRQHGAIGGGGIAAADQSAGGVVPAAGGRPPGRDPRGRGVARTFCATPGLRPSPRTFEICWRSAEPQVTTRDDAARSRGLAGKREDSPGGDAPVSGQESADRAAAAGPLLQPAMDAEELDFLQTCAQQLAIAVENSGCSRKCCARSGSG